MPDKQIHIFFKYEYVFGHEMHLRDTLFAVYLKFKFTWVSCIFISYIWQSSPHRIYNQLCLQDGLSPGVSLVLVTVTPWPACLTDLPARCDWLPNALCWALWQEQLHSRWPASLVTGLDSQSVSPLHSETKTGPPSLVRTGTWAQKV